MMILEWKTLRMKGEFIDLDVVEDDDAYEWEDQGGTGIKKKDLGSIFCSGHSRVD